MKLWSIRNLDELKSLQEQGFLHTEPSLVDPYFINAYAWMSEKLNNKVKKDDDAITYPVWVWRQWKDVNKKRPDLRSIRTQYGIKRGNQGVMLTLEIPDHLVLLSDFESWHCVLNGFYNSIDEEDYHDFEEKIKLVNKKEKSKIIKKSWDRVFNYDENNDRIQGVVWSLKEEYIRKIEYFKAL